MQDKKLLLILVLSVLSVGANFWGFPIYILDESKNAACAMEMIQRGDLVTPTFNGELRTDKPPLHYFFMMASYAAFGVTPFSARLFSVVFGILTVVMVYFFVRKTDGERAAFFSAITLLGSLYFNAQFHLAVPDPYFIFFLTASWLCFGYAWQTKQSIYFYLSYAAVGLACLAKGPAAIVLTGVVFALFLLIHREVSFTFFTEIKFWPGVLIFLAINTPWWTAVTVATNGAWTSAFIWGHNVGRFLAPFEGHGPLPGQSFLLFFICLLPLSLFLPKAFLLSWRDRISNPLASICLVGAATVVVFFAFSKTFLPNYIGPAIPVGGILIGRYLDHVLKNTSTVGKAWIVGGVLALIATLAIPFAAYQAIIQDRWIGDLGWLSWLFGLLPLGAIVALICILRQKLHLALVTYSMSWWLLAIVFFYAAVPPIMAKNPIGLSMPIIRESGREVVAYYFFNTAYVFAFQRPLPTFYTPEAIRAYSTGKSIIVVTRKDYEVELTAVGFRVIYEKPYLFEGQVVIVMINETP